MDQNGILVQALNRVHVELLLEDLLLVPVPDHPSATKYQVGDQGHIRHGTGLREIIGQIEEVLDLRRLLLENALIKKGTLEDLR